VFVKGAVRPIRKADFFFGGGMCLLQSGNQDPSESWPGALFYPRGAGKRKFVTALNGAGLFCHSERSEESLFD
jgi:hypothetical protein